MPGPPAIWNVFARRGYDSLPQNCDFDVAKRATLIKCAK
jgi:hypothetical protein